MLRDYHPLDAADAIRKMHRRLAPGGMLVEGSSHSDGRLLVAALLAGSEEAATADTAPVAVAAVIFAADLVTFAADAHGQFSMEES